MTDIEVIQTINTINANVSLIGTNVAVTMEKVNQMDTRVAELSKRLYNGGSGDITVILKRIGKVEERQQRWSGVTMAVGFGCTLCTAFLAIVEMVSLLHGKPVR